ncbi:hypothetical protein QFZ94_006600 [Paraburkholderia sp. JPY465]|uniref:hypothetical protein n=1 Tax=Paraburkholderia sp. JPY465 TaxID=3042285 RepID=UPI003D25B70B
MKLRIEIDYEKVMAILFLVAWLLLQSKNVFAGENENNIPDMEIVFAASAKGTDPMFGKEIPWRVVRQFDLLCQSGNCYLNVTTLNDETCDGKTKPTGWNIDGVDKATYSNGRSDENQLEVKAAGSDAIQFKFKDGLVGDALNNPTENTLIVSYEDDDPSVDQLKSIARNRLKSGELSKSEYQKYISSLNKDRTLYKKATKLTGNAVGVSLDLTAQGKREVRSVQYTLLTAPVFCTIAFWPKMR